MYLPNLYIRTYSGVKPSHIRMYNAVYIMLNKNTLGVKKVRGQSEAALQI